MSKTRQKSGESDRHYFGRCREPETELGDLKCSKCGCLFETDGSDEGLCYECEQEYSES